MSVFAELADGRRLEFPDGTDPAVIQITVKKMLSPEKAPTKSGLPYNAPGSGLEPIAAMATGAIAKPVSDVAGLAAIPLHAAGMISTDPGAVKQAVQQGMTYQPRTEVGRQLTEYNPLALMAKGVDWLGSQAEGGPNASPLRTAVGQGIHEAVNQAPGLLGAKFSPSPLLQDSSSGLMRSALKPSTTMSLADSGSVVQTLLDQGINVSKSGLEKLRSKINDTNQAIKDAISGSDATVSRDAVAGRLRPLVDKTLLQVDPTADMAAIANTRQAFLDHPLMTPNIPVGLAQDIKQGTYRALGDKAYTGENTAASTAAQKTLARGLKEEIASTVPGVADLNALDSKLINALDPLEHRVIVELNKNPAGLSILTHSPAAFMAFMADRSAAFKSVIARMLNASAEPTGAATTAAGLLSSQGAGVVPSKKNSLLGYQGE